MQHSLSQLQHIARRARLLLIAGEGALVVGVVLAFATGCVLLDWWLRFPSAVRAGMLVMLTTVAWQLTRRRVLPAFRFRPTTLDIAFRIEQREPQLRNLLASAVEFSSAAQQRSASHSDEAALESQLAQRLVARVTRFIEGATTSPFRSTLRYGPSLRRACTLFATTGVCISFLAWSPDLFGIGVTRLLSPWSGARWPARTEVHSLLGGAVVHARGIPLPLRAALIRGDGEHERVWAAFRVKHTADATWGDWDEVLLARQPNGVYERLMEVDGEEMEVVFRSSDNESLETHISIVDSPALVQASFIAEPPAYLQNHNISVDPISQPLGDGTDARAVVLDPVLEGSAVRITAQLNVIAEVSIAGSEGFDGTVQVSDEAPTNVTIDGIAAGASKIHVKLHDHYGIENRAEIGFVFDTILDRVPTAAVVDPSHDESFVVDAVVPLRGELRDDFGLSRAGFEFSVRRASTHDAAEPESVREDVVEVSGVLAEESRTLTLSSFSVKPGDTILVRAVAEDIFELPGARHTRTQSAPRALRIVGAEEFEQQVRTAIANVRRDATRTDALQARAQERLSGALRTTDEKPLAQAQAEVGEALARHTLALNAVARRLERNQQGDGELSRLAQEASAMSEEAAIASSDATEQIMESENPESSDTIATTAKSQASKSQEQVRADLEGLIALLDRDADSWLSKRHIEELRERIESLIRKTDALAQRTHAQARDELPAEERAALDELASEQQDAANDTDALVDELRTRQEATKDLDPALARALEQAATAAKEGRAREAMEQASEATKSNQLAQAGASERNAAQALARAEQALKDVGKIRAEELARVLESLVESVQRIIEQTERLLPQFTRAQDAELHARAIGQVSQNTRGLASDARGAGRAASRVAAPLERAAESLSTASSLLRREEPVVVDAIAAGESAIVSLHEALSLAEDAKERAQQDAATEKREELLEKYRSLLEQELALKALTQKIADSTGTTPTRREQLELRRLALTQGEVRDAISGLLSDEESISKSPAFTDVHKDIDQFLGRAVETLNRAESAEAVVAQTDGAQGLADLITALGEDEDEDPFTERQPPQGETGGGGGSAPSSEPIPPLAELKLLRQMQRQLFQRTLQLESARERGLAEDSLIAQRAALAERQARIVELTEAIANSMEKSKATPTDQKPTTTPEASPPTTPSRQQARARKQELRWLA